MINFAATDKMTWEPVKEVFGNNFAALKFNKLN